VPPPYNAGVIHLIHGKDDYLVRRALSDFRAKLAEGDDMLDANTTVLEGHGLTPAELLGHATAAPFLANSRLVIVEDLLLALGEVKRGRSRKKGDGDDPLEPWRKVAAQLADPALMPPTTTLVFIEGPDAEKSPAFEMFSAGARVTECNPLDKRGVIGWAKAVAEEKGVTLGNGVAERLADLAGHDLWALDNELTKLAAFAAGETVDLTAVHELVVAAQEAKIYELTDAVVAGNVRKAASALQRLLAAGEPPQKLLISMVRPYRQLALVKDAIDRRADAERVARALGVPPFKVRDTTRQAGQYTWPQLRGAYRRLVDADLNVKRGLVSDETSLQLLVHDLCSLATQARASAIAGRR
jgi:DNA polymerase-3 subunit delta